MAVCSLLVKFKLQHQLQIVQPQVQDATAGANAQAVGGGHFVGSAAETRSHDAKDPGSHVLLLI